jgi:hypothetical protein
LRIGKRASTKTPTRRWTPEESAAFDASLAARDAEQRPELATVKNLPTRGPTRCAGCGLPIEWGQPRIESWTGWADGDPRPESPERAWHSHQCLSEDDERGARRQEG